MLALLLAAAASPRHGGVAWRRAATTPPRARPAILTADARLAELPQLVQLVEARGGTAKAVRAAAAANTGLGLETRRAVKRGEVLLAVPASLALSAESALRSAELGPSLATFEPMLAEYSFIALQLLQQRFAGDASELAPWLSSSALPADGFDDLPLLWPEEERAELQASTTLGFGQRLAGAAADFEWLEENVFSASPMEFPPFVFTADAFRAALALAFSRAVPLPIKEGASEVQLALLPLLDLVNHDSSPTSALKVRAARGGLFGAGASDAMVELVALEDLPEGSPLTRRYGRGEVGAELLVDFGFIEKRLPASAMLTFELDDQNDRNYDDKLDCLERNGLSDLEYWVLSEEQCAAEGLPTDLLAFLRLKHLNGADCFLLESIFADSLWSEHLQLPVSEENERSALQDAASAVVRYKEGLAGSLQTDLQILGEAPEKSRAYMMASVRYAERRALEAAARWIEARLLRLETLEYYQERRLNALGLNPIESDEELEALKAAGRSYGASEIEW
ncbi:hypothetical protein AB1Y20_015002 [Prymnesium parvum]|uniref:Rubisco LSMT substrate-binding domain-containing protein n=1 Tax=Prymnesium parvum TaxID=97485 RepID=A0AB34K199_PRYPA